MTQEDKQLLFVDLCARLPYGVKIHYTKHPNSSVDEDTDDTVQGYYSNLVVGGKADYCLDRCKPYLRPMSSMTEDELQRYHELCDVDEAVGVGSSIEIIAAHDTPKSLDYLNSIHVDYRGLIPQGLAIAVTVHNNPYRD